MNTSELKAFLDEKVALYHNPTFIDSDPIQIPHLFSKKEDIEIAGFLTAIISWGNRKMIIKSASKIMRLLDNTPYDFVINHSEKDITHLESFVHRTFNTTDLQYFIKSLRNVYKKYQGLENAFSIKDNTTDYKTSISKFKRLFFELPHPKRTQKHISDPEKNSAAKRINMFLRWMVRDASMGVDLGLWKTHSSSQLSCPLDVHSGNVARKLTILHRKQNDWKAVSELDMSLRTFDSNDPVKYDFALFGLGVFEKF
ncbi:MAG: TIGR02757 family protein [Flavobacteriaceae bacterium]|nr:MAG: TIGR02757 family protein [Flavobacteriaceae bacterium]